MEDKGESIWKTKALERIEKNTKEILAVISPPEIDDGAFDEILKGIESPVQKKRLCDYVFSYGQTMHQAGISVGRNHD